MAGTRKIEIVITTYNEEKNILDCITSAKRLAENITVIDTESTDNTVLLTRTEGVGTLSFPFSRFVEPARKFAIEQSNADWIFILDADERITDELATEIKRVIIEGNKTHYSLPRKNIFAGKKWLNHGGWYPDIVLRLIKKDAFIDWPAQIHVVPRIKGDKGELKNPLLHFFHPSLEGMVTKTAIFEDIESDLLYNAHKKSNTPIFFRKYFGELNRRLIKGMGFLDGSFGIIESIYQAYSKTVTYLMLYEKTKKSTSL